MQSESDKHIQQVARGYDAVADAYFDNYRKVVPETVSTYVDNFDSQLPPGSAVLELGCGSGIPFTAQLAASHIVTGIDVSTNQIEKARANVPSAKFQVADMTSVSSPANSFDGIIALYSIIHVPRERHAKLFESISSWLKPGGTFLASLGSEDSENWIEEDWFGAEMYWSNFAPEFTRQLIEKSGLEIEIDKIEELISPDDGETERHYWVQARMPG
jgi:cyclopropane fatty-acyl-phospholipid synthase-like methyltransferase